MSAMVISSIKTFIEMSPKLEEVGVRNIHFYNSKSGDVHDAPMVSLVPFVDLVVLGKDANLSPQINKIVKEALDRHIPLVTEDCLGELAEAI